MIPIMGGVVSVVIYGRGLCGLCGLLVIVYPDFFFWQGVYGRRNGGLCLFGGVWVRFKTKFFDW